jgi:Domain of unknown function (DUF5666)
MIRFGQGRNGFFHLCVTLALSGLLLAANAGAAQDAEKPGASVGKAVGTIQLISGKNLTVASDAGTTVHVVIEDSTRLLRTEPGAKDLKGATPITLSACAPGDRVLVRGTPATDGQSLVALSVIVIKHADVAAKQQQDVEDWQKRGIGGLVTKSDPAAGTVTISTASLSGIKSTTIHISKQTIVRRYSPDSVKFDDATPATLDQIKPGDQLRARGTKNADNTELTAEEVVFGTFRNIAGLVLSTDPSTHSVSVQDLTTKKPVVLKIDGASELRSLPPAVAQRIAARLKGAPAGASGVPPSGQGGVPSGGAPPPAANRGGGRTDFQQMLNRMPAVSLADLQKGAAVMIVATEGSPQSPPTAITLLTGVEPILTASPDSRRAAMLLSPWNLGGSESEGSQ